MIDNEAWRVYQENAKLTSIKVVRLKPSHDVADLLDPKLVGRMVYEVKPRWGSEGFGGKVKNLLFGKTVSAQQLLGLSDVQETDETRLTLDDGDQSRQVILGGTQLPALVYLIDHDGTSRAKDDVMYDGMVKAVPGLVKQLQLELPDWWDSRSWDQKQLGVRMGAKRER